MRERNSLVVIDRTEGNPDRARRSFQLDRTEDGALGLTIGSRLFEPGDPITPWREALHPWDAGIGRDRIIQPRRYLRANADLSWRGTAVPPGASVLIEGVTGPFTARPFFWNDYYWLVCGVRLYRVDSSRTATLERTFDNPILCTEVFNQELVVGFGDEQFIEVCDESLVWTASTEVNARALHVVQEQLHRVDNRNEVTRCSTDPEMLANWGPTPAYYAGDTTYEGVEVLDYNGALWTIKGDGAYQIDPRFKFRNQNPPMSQWPDAENGVGSFIAMGYLWIPTKTGLYRLAPGEAFLKGPEITERGWTGMRVRHGVEWQGDILLSCSDASPDSNFIVKVMRDDVGYSNSDYIYHQIKTLPGPATYLGVATTFVPPSGGTAAPGLVFDNSDSTEVYVMFLGRGGGRDIDCSCYQFDTTWDFESGDLFPGGDMAVQNVLVGATVTCKLERDQTIELSVSVDDRDEFYPLLRSQDEGGGREIRDTQGMSAHTLFADDNTVGQMFNVKVSGVLGSTVNGRTRRPEVREVAVFGFSRPKRVTVIEAAIVAGPSTTSGMPQPYTAEEIHNLFLSWENDKTVVELEIPGYEEHEKVRAVVAAVERRNVVASPRGGGGDTETRDSLRVSFVRADFGGKHGR